MGLLFDLELLHDLVVLRRRGQTPVEHVPAIVYAEEGDQFQGLVLFWPDDGRGRKGHGPARHGLDLLSQGPGVLGNEHGGLVQWDQRSVGDVDPSPFTGTQALQVVLVCLGSL